MTRVPDNDPDSLREFYETDYPRGLLETRLLPDDDFMYGQVLGQLRPYLQPGLQVLDLGCSIGAVALYMASRGCDVLGVDLARNAVEAARANALRLGISGARFEAMDFAAEWRQPGSFDFILSSFVLEHVVDDVAFMAAIATALRPGGQALVFTGAIYTSACYLGRWLPRVFVSDVEVGHLRRYTGASLREVTRRAGLIPERIVFLDSVIREWSILCKPIRRVQKILGLPVLRRGVNGLDALLARFLFPGTVVVHATKAEGGPGAMGG